MSAPRPPGFSRSRSPPRVGQTRALQPLRQDDPPKYQRSRGVLPTLATPTERDRAVQELVADFYAPSSRKAIEMKLRTCTTAVRRFGLDLFPPSKETVIALGATLKAGGYLSADSYIQLYRTESERRGFAFTTDLARTFTDVVRSCRRGLGGPAKPMALPFMRLQELGLDEDEPWCAGGPVGPTCALVAGAWFLTRELELSTARAALIEFDRDEAARPIVRWRLPVSKNDPSALGVARSHGCSCVDGKLGCCPWHALDRQLRRLRTRFPQKFVDDVPSLDLPLFPAADGAAVSKDAMTETIRVGAARLGVKLAAADGSTRVTGHSLRVTGAQGLARLGVDTWAVQLLGRWGSSTVLEYVQAVPLERSSEWARRAATVTLEQLASTASPAPPSFEAASIASLPAEAGGKTDIKEALEVVREASAPSSSASFVVSTLGLWHRVPSHGASGPTASWTTSCGWRFAGKELKSASELPESLCYKFMCARCLGPRREAAKASVSAGKP